MTGEGDKGPGWSGPAFPGPGWSFGPPPGDEVHEVEVTDWTADAKHVAPTGSDPTAVTAPIAIPDDEAPRPDVPADPEPAPATIPDPIAEAAEAAAVSEALAEAHPDDQLAADDLPHPATVASYEMAVAPEVPAPPVEPPSTVLPAWATTPGPLPAPGGPPVLASAAVAPAEVPGDTAPLLGVAAVAGHDADAEVRDVPDELEPSTEDRDHAPLLGLAAAGVAVDEVREPAVEPGAPPEPDDPAVVEADVPMMTGGPVPVAEPVGSDALTPPAARSPRIGRVLPWAGPALLVFLVSLLLDLRTIMPGLGYWDTGEFQTLGPVLGIAHPTGYPSYTLLLWLASVVLQPFGEAAFRANLLSALLVSGAAAFTAIAIVQLTRRWWLGIVGGLALAVAPIAWRNALRADPHAFQVFLVGLLLVLLIAWAERERAGSPRAGRWLIAASAAFALAVTNHGLTVALAPGVAVYVLLVQPRILWLRWKTVLACLGTLAVLTVAIYAYLPLRSSMHPPLDYAHPANWVNTNAEGEVTGGFKYLVLGEQFSGKVEIPPAGDWPAILPDRLVDGTRIATDVLREAYGSGALLETLGYEPDASAAVPILGDTLPFDALGLPLLMLAGIPLGLWRRPRETILTLLWFVLTFVVALGYPNADITRYYLAPLLVACVWAALAVDGLIAIVRWLVPGVARGPDPAEPVGGSPRLARALIGGLLAIALLVPTLQAIPARMTDLDASTDVWARRWLDATLAALPENAVVVSWWSYSTPLWYGTYVEGRRPDITVIDDRDIVDQDLGNVPTVVASYMAEGTRPVFVVRLDRDLAEIESDWRLEPLEGVPSGEPVYRVVDPVGGG